MSVSFDQLLAMLNENPHAVDRARYCVMTPGIVHLVLHLAVEGNGFGEAFLTTEQFASLRVQFPDLNVVETGTFPLPPK